MTVRDLMTESASSFRLWLVSRSLLKIAVTDSVTEPVIESVFSFSVWQIVFYRRFRSLLQITLVGQLPHETYNAHTMN